MDFGKVLTRSWEIIWKHKVLWIFGILASCGGQYRSSSINYSYDSSSSPNGQLPPGLQNWLQQLQLRFNNIPSDRLTGIIIGLACLFILIAILFALIAVFGRVSLIKGAQQAENGMALNFSQLARDAYDFFWRAVGLNILLAIIPIAIGLILGVIAIFFSAITLGIGALCLVPLACLLVPVFLAYAVYVQIANLALVVDELPVMDAISRGWDVLSKHFGNIAVMALILLIGGGIVNFLISLPIIAVVAPAVIGLVVGTQNAFTTGLTITAICLVLALPVFILLGGVLQSYLQSAWTLTYLELTAPAPKAKKVVNAKPAG